MALYITGTNNPDDTIITVNVAKAAPVAPHLLINIISKNMLATPENTLTYIDAFTFRNVAKTFPAVILNVADIK